MAAKGRRSICLTFNKHKMADLGLDISVVGEGDDSETILEMALGSEPLLHEDFKRHVICELGAGAFDEMHEKVLVAYAGIALKGTLG